MKSPICHKACLKLRASLPVETMVSPIEGRGLARHVIGKALPNNELVAFACFPAGLPKAGNGIAVMEEGWFPGGAVSVR